MKEKKNCFKDLAIDQTAALDTAAKDLETLQAAGDKADAENVKLQAAKDKADKDLEQMQAALKKAESAKVKLQAAQAEQTKELEAAQKEVRKHESTFDICRGELLEYDDKAKALLQEKKDKYARLGEHFERAKEDTQRALERLYRCAPEERP